LPLKPTTFIRVLELDPEHAEAEDAVLIAEEMLQSVSETQPIVTHVVAQDR